MNCQKLKDVQLNKLSDQKIILTDEQIDFLLSPKAIRERTKKIFDLTREGKTHFIYHPEKMDATVNYVLQVIKKNYPLMDIPFHSRWGHFRVGKIDRVKRLDETLSRLDALEKARTKLDLVITSVLLDAGAGAAWKFFEKESDKSFSRSEGLGVASLYMFLKGTMSSDRKTLRADREGLKNISINDLKEAFQVSETNPLVGGEGRVLLLNNLSKALENKTIFKDGRPGNIIDYLIAKYGKDIPASGVLRAVLDGLGPIWPGRLEANGINLGDVWSHSQLGKAGSFESLIPFHKLSQWMTYSLIEPIMEAGVEVTGVEGLTGLAEYRNGGLLIDSGLVTMKDLENFKKPWSPDSELIIEWRALTVYLLDRFGDAVQKAIGKTPQEFPLAKVLEGGTWWAGRFLAQEKRPSGDPPIMIKSDGTVF
ncbi:MAG: URC4/urg3 family protein [Bdellovibrionota bacterium]